jgi:hypothetical protein
MTFQEILGELFDGNPFWAGVDHEKWLVISGQWLESKCG